MLGLPRAVTFTAKGMDYRQSYQEVSDRRINATAL